MKSKINKAEIVVLGGGPAGLCAAIAAARKLKCTSKQVVLLDSNPRPGAKLLISGSGQCNFTNALEPTEFLTRLGKYANYLKAAYLNFDNLQFAQLLNDGGCPNFIREDGKVFPDDFKSQTVLNALLEQLQRSGAMLSCSSRVIDINSRPEGGYSLSFENGDLLECRKLIMATGGASYPATGSDGKALRFARKLGHEVIPFRPHLCPVKIANFDFYKRCAGITIPYAHAEFVTLNGRTEAVGDLLITHEGFSGPLIMDNSYLLQKGDQVVMNWVDYADELLISLKKNLPKTSLLNALSISHIPRNLLSTILDVAMGDSYKPMIEFGDKKLREIGGKLMRMPYIISQVSSFAKAMASAGGVSLTEINAKTMQSRICPGLYFAGEIMDYALPTGGFNIQIAASTGWMAGEHAAGC